MSEFDHPIGKTQWFIPGGYVPTDSTGSEPEMVSRDVLCLLNTGDELTTAEVTLYYADGRVAGPYSLTLAARRVRHIRINDLIDPFAPPLGEAYGMNIKTTTPIVVQQSRQDTRAAANASLSTIGYSDD